MPPIWARMNWGVRSRCMARGAGCGSNLNLLLILLAIASLSAQPVRSVWIRGAPQGAASIDRIRAEVPSVDVTGDEVIVRSAGTSLAYLGPLASPPQPRDERREFVFRFPLRPERETGRHPHVPREFVGAFLNGVPIYNQFEA